MIRLVWLLVGLLVILLVMVVSAAHAYCCGYQHGQDAAEAHMTRELEALARRLVPAVLLVVAALLDLVIPHPAGVVRADFGTGAAGAIVGALAGLAGIFKGKVDKNTKLAFELLRAGVVTAFEAVASFASETGAKVGRSVNIFKKLFSSVLLPVLSKIDSFVKKAHGWLEKTLGPILRTLLKYRKKILDFYNHWFRPIFDTIDVIRHVLQLLSFLHVDVARKLDQKLAALEDRLLRPLQIVIGKINEIVDQVTLVIDGFGLFQRLTLIESEWKYVGDMWAVLLKHQPAGVSREQNEEMRMRKVVAVDPAALRGAVIEYYATGGGELAPAVNANVAIWQSLTAE